MRAAETTTGMEELQQLPRSLKMNQCRTCLLSKSRAQPPPKQTVSSAHMVHYLIQSHKGQRTSSAR
eukprot:2743242-Rhodomonas_salina.9